MKTTKEITDEPIRLDDINEQFEEWMDYIALNEINARLLLDDDLFQGMDELETLLRELDQKEIKIDTKCTYK